MIDFNFDLVGWLVGYYLTIGFLIGKLARIVVGGTVERCCGYARCQWVVATRFARCNFGQMPVDGGMMLLLLLLLLLR